MFANGITTPKVKATTKFVSNIYIYSYEYNKAIVWIQ
jgi:hypothetical protein